MASVSNAITTQRARLARVLLAASASTLMTCVVALPMAYQAQAARADQSVTRPVNPPDSGRRTTSTLPPASVLGATTIAESPTTTPTGPAEIADSPTTSPRKPASPRTTAPSRSPSATTPVDPPVTSLEEPSTAPPTSSPTSSVPAPTTTEVRSSPEGLRWSASDSLSSSEALQGAQIVTGTAAIFIFLDASVLDGIDSVKFFLDDVLRATEESSPWELLGGASLDPTSLSTGQHTVRAEIRLTDGRTLVREATFSKP
ncbi:MAG: Ig-like domain-containing protein [Actinomycetes bacterium]